MSDIVERLRVASDIGLDDDAIFVEAADEIERLRKAEADARREIAEKCARMVTSSFGLRCSADGELNDLANAMRARAAEEG